MSNLKSKIFKSIFLPFADMYFKTDIIFAYNEIKKLSHLSRNEITNWQNDKLQRLVFHAYNHTEYYRCLFDELGICVSDIRSISDLKKLPILTKELVRSNFEKLIPDNIVSYPYKKSATGGSTGDPLIYYLDNKSWSRTNANYIYNWERCGYNYGDKYIALGSTSLFVNKRQSLKHKLYYFIKSKIGLNGINMSQQNCKEYISLIKQNKINYIYGYASSIYLLAKYVLENNMKIKIRACFPTSEILTEHYKSVINKAFDCIIINCYGANDGGVTAFSHEKDYFEVGYNCIMHIEENIVSKQAQGSVLLTDLFNYSMPLINYKVGDEIKIDIEQNKISSYNGQIFNEIIGRTSDIIILENGATITGPGFTVLFKDMPVEAYCIRKSGNNTIECDIQKLDGFNSLHETIIESSFRNQMGENSVFKINYVSEIPLSENGKRKYFQN